MESKKLKNQDHRFKGRYLKESKNVKQSDLGDIQVHVQMITIKIQGRSNMCITDVTIMATQYAIRCHVKSRGVMAINEQCGSVLNNQS